MKSSNDTIDGTIVGYDEKTGELIIRARYDDIYTLTKRQYKKCRIRLDDSRPLSCKQRNSCYAILREIADYSGMSEDRTKEMMKLKFLSETLEDAADDMFSLSDAPMSLVCEFQRFLVRFVLDWDIPVSFPLYEFVDDVGDYIYACAVAKKCAICGSHADLHHMVGSRVGMGRDREEIIHIGLETIPLCREHHTEAHTIGEQTWKEKYKIEHGLIVDESIAKIYKLNTKNKKEN